MSTTFTATIDHVVHTTSRATVRTHAVLVDRPRAKGGNDLGPVGGEYLLVALGGCFTSHLLAAMRAREVTLDGIRVVISGTLGATPERFTALAVDVTADDPDTALLDKLVTIAARGCQVMNTLRLAVPIAVTSQGSPIELAQTAEPAV
jgi:putative redox protein